MNTIAVEIDGKTEEVTIEKKSIRVDELLESLNIYPETAVVLKDGKLLCDDERIKPGDRVKIVIATSKG
ncbi:sulfur carrier protein [Desulfurobacterium pacificum]|uniref:Sulfur carrier protein n=1 Tax=Desulfurobacterium pacificum TaxID=240166 RepID=A0ABY1NMZ4_9BACT|nr:MoaD/ThiS family protein [Desulfurobacterium pacificum]SMP13956.1 sulfur carrier protein [Desulfurobacterium pacificum]